METSPRRAQYLTSSEITLTFVLVGAVALAVAFILAPAKRERILRTVKPILFAGIGALIVCSPVIYYELHGIVRFGAGTGDVDGSDLLGFVVPPDLVRLGYTFRRSCDGLSPDRPASAEATLRQSRMWACHSR